MALEQILEGSVVGDELVRRTEVAPSEIVMNSIAERCQSRGGERESPSPPADSAPGVPEYEDAVLQNFDPLRHFRGFHVRPPCRKKAAQPPGQMQSRHRAYVHSIPWAVLADGMWFEQAPGMTVPPGKTAPWLPDGPAVIPPHWEESTGVKRRPKGIKEAAMCGRRVVTDTGVRDLDTHSVGSLCCRHSSAANNVVVGTNHLPKTGLQLAQPSEMTPADMEKLYQVVGGRHVYGEDWAEKHLGKARAAVQNNAGASGHAPSKGLNQTL